MYSGEGAPAERNRRVSAVKAAEIRGDRNSVEAAAPMSDVEREPIPVFEPPKSWRRAAGCASKSSASIAGVARLQRWVMSQAKKSAISASERRNAPGRSDADCLMNSRRRCGFGAIRREFRRNQCPVKLCERAVERAPGDEKRMKGVANCGINRAAWNLV